MGSAQAMLDAARADLGMSGRPNDITRWYAARHGDEFLRAPWCQQAISYWAHKSGNADAVLPGGDRAYTVTAALDYQAAGQWITGTRDNVNAAQPGDVVYFDWGGSVSVPYIDHVGVVEKALGNGAVQTIEGNTVDACKRRVREHTVIAGFGRPDYGRDGDVLRTVVDLGAKDPQTIKAGARGSLAFEIEYADPDRVHTDARPNGTRYPSIFPVGPRSPYVIRLALEMATPPGVPVTVVWAAYKRAANTWVSDHSPHQLTSGLDQVVTWTEMMDESGKYRADVINDSTQDLVISRAFLLIAH